MLASTGSSPKQSSTFVEALKDKLKDRKNFSNWSAKEQVLVVSAVGMIFGTALLVLTVALPVAATGAVVALTVFFAVKAVEYTFKGLKWSAEKTVEGAKYTAGKIRDGTVYVKDSVKEAASSLKQVAREGTSSALKKMGDGVQKLGREMSNSGASISDLEDIPYSIEQQEPQGVVLLAKRELDPDLIGSDRDLKRDSLQSNSLSRSNSISSLNSVCTGGSTAELLDTEENKKVKTTTSLWNRLVSLFKVGKESEKTSEVKYQTFESGTVPPATVDPKSLRRDSSSSLSSDSSKLKEIAPPQVPKSSFLDSLNSDSGIGSGYSTPKRLNLSGEDLSKARSKLRRTGSLGQLVGQQPPSTTMTEPGAAQTAVKTVG